MEIQFFLPMIPPTVTAQEHKVAVVRGKPRFYDPPEVKEARAKLMAALAAHVPEKPSDSAVRIVVKWLFPLTGKHRNGEYKSTKPDTDNLQKLLKDCMTKCGFWRDDALVASEITEKFWADVPGIWIRIEEL
ncbi:MAG: RusA family crossover junction endodeoxyribonuclease [Oscillospiraceae bacterium]